MTATLNDEIVDLRRANAELRGRVDELQRRVDQALAERDESLQRETATTEVLQVINSSPGDLGPVFDAMLERARRLCEPAFGVMLTWDGKLFHRVAWRGAPPEVIEATREPVIGPPGSPGYRIAHGESVVSIADLATNEATRHAPAMQTWVRLGVHSYVAVALRKVDTLLGAIVVYRLEVRPFIDKEIALLQNFAAQAVIAIENAQLVTETHEALEQQTATAEVLQVINASPGDLASVFDAILEKARQRTGAIHGDLWTYDGECFHLVATHGEPGFSEWLRQQGPLRPWAGSGIERLLKGEDYVHLDDALQHNDFRFAPEFLKQTRIAGIRTVLTVPLRREGVVLGLITVYRREVLPFSDKQIALLQNFAAQAVIAMENARLLTETREALEQQTATAEVLGVINSSPGDLMPVFDAMLERSMRLCEAAFGFLSEVDGEELRVVALRNLPEKYAEYLRHPHRLDQVAVGEVIQRGQIFQINDLADTDAYRQRRAIPVASVEIGHVRSALYAPLMKDDRLLGVIVLFRQEVRPFSDKQIALVENFAAQAVIAMENARLITETREALEQQTATAEVLQVINSSPGDLGPVFDAILEKAIRLCDADCGQFSRIDGQQFTIAAIRGEPRLAEWLRQRGPVRPSLGTTMDKILRGEDLIQVVDMKNDEAYRRGDPTRRMLVDVGGYRSGLSIALRKEGRLLGAFTINRKQVRPFTDKQMALLQSFGAQAAIAIENARLITETREALEQQTATAEVLGVINSSPGDLLPVFEAIVEKAHTLCDAVSGSLQLWDGEKFRGVAMRGFSQAMVEGLRQGYIPGPKHPCRRLLEGARVAHCLDLAEIDDPVTRAGGVAQGGVRTILFVALRKDDVLLGQIVAARREVRPFSEKEIALVENFAAQAVIAIENARLITETREALEQQTATAEVLQVINSSPGDLAPVFEAMLDRAARLCDAPSGIFWTFDGEYSRAAAMRGIPDSFAEYVSKGMRLDPQTGLGRVRQGARVAVSLDLAAEEPYRAGNPQRRAFVDLGRARSAVRVPLIRDEKLLGIFTVYRQEVRPFTDKQIALLQSFAAQAVIAMENARLLNEIRQRQAELRVTFDNMVDGVAMFDGELRLAAWNRNFQELLDLTDDYLAKRHGFDEFVRYLTERGEFGETDPEAEIHRLRGRLNEHYQFERTRPDGTVIEVRHNPMPDGGVVMIYSDITERKRSEAEIRAARDAAEAAYRDLKAAQASLIQAEKMASLGQLTAGIAHEIKNPLNFVNNFAGLSVELLDELKETAAPGDQCARRRKAC
jgi:PAS domain S-box-containing protein